MDIPRHLETARKYAMSHTFDKSLSFRHAALIVKGGKILSVGFNYAHDINLRFNPELARRVGRLQNENHAESVSLLKLLSIKMDKDLSNDYKMYVVRVNRNGMMANSTPCELCRNFILNTGIVKKVCYTISNDEFGTWLPSRRPSHQ